MLGVCNENCCTLLAHFLSPGVRLFKAQGEIRGHHSQGLLLCARHSWLSPQIRTPSRAAIRWREKHAGSQTFTHTHTDARSKHRFAHIHTHTHRSEHRSAHTHTFSQTRFRTVSTQRQKPAPSHTLAPTHMHTNTFAHIHAGAHPLTHREPHGPTHMQGDSHSRRRDQKRKRWCLLCAWLSWMRPLQGA